MQSIRRGGRDTAVSEVLQKIRVPRFQPQIYLFHHMQLHVHQDGEAQQKMGWSFVILLSRRSWIALLMDL